MSGPRVPWPLTIFHYEPSVPLAIVFAALFGITGVVHGVQAWRTRVRYMWAVVFGCMLEVVGFILRIKAKDIAQSDPRNNSWYSGQFACIVIAPIFFAAAVYILLSRIVALLGHHYSPINTNAIAKIFVGADVTAFTIQITGSMVILIPKTQSTTDTGLKILIAGLAVQVISIFIFLFLAMFVYIRAKHVKGIWHVLMWNCIVCSVLILIRNTFRVAEFWGGFDSELAKTETLVYALDAGLMFLLAILFNVIHPAYTLKKVVEEDEVAEQLERGKPGEGEDDK